MKGFKVASKYRAIPALNVHIVGVEKYGHGSGSTPDSYYYIV